jgi:hypothetical protein
MIHHLTTLNTPNYAQTPLNRSHFLTTPHLDDYACRLCQCIPNQPLQIFPCQHFLCMSCVRHLCGSEKDITCPCNELQELGAHIDSGCTEVHLPPPSKVTVEQLLQLPPSSWLYTAIMGLVAEKITLTSTPVTLRSSSGKVCHQLEIEVWPPRSLTIARPCSWGKRSLAQTSS